MKNLKMKVKHYPRVSTKKQVKQGDSVDVQDKKLKRDSEEKGDEVVDIVMDEGYSASISDDKIHITHKDGIVTAKIDIKKRKGMNKILDTLKEDNWDALKITKWDRFSRNNIFSQLMILHFKEHNKQIIAVDDSNDSLVRDILNVLGQKEIDKLIDRVRDGRINQFEKGIIVGRCPVGYKPIFKDKEHKRGIIKIVPHPKESEMIKDVFKLASEGIDYKTICKKHKLHPQQYYNIIRNKVYTGIVTFEGVEKKGIHEPLITEETFNKVQTLIKT